MNVSDDGRDGMGWDAPRAELRLFAHSNGRQSNFKRVSHIRRKAEQAVGGLLAGADGGSYGSSCLAGVGGRTVGWLVENLTVVWAFTLKATPTQTLLWATRIIRPQNTSWTQRVLVGAGGCGVLKKEFQKPARKQNLQKELLNHCKEIITLHGILPIGLTGCVTTHQHCHSKVSHWIGHYFSCKVIPLLCVGGHFDWMELPIKQVITSPVYGLNGWLATNV